MGFLGMYLPPASSSYKNCNIQVSSKYPARLIDDTKTDWNKHDFIKTNKLKPFGLGI